MSPTRQSPTPVEQTGLRGVFWVLSVLTALSVVWVVWDETLTRRPWKNYQERFNALLARHQTPAEPIEIRQVTNPELGVVDRCPSCHVGIDRAGLDGADVPRVFRTHPRRLEVLGANHPVDRFGCTPCHRGQGPQTKGTAWKSFDHGRDDPYWEEPLATGSFVESTCVTCHTDEDPIPTADDFNRGREIFYELRCHGCHSSPLVDERESRQETAPPLAQLTTKSSHAFVESWLADPRAFRPDTRMPRFWPPPVDPASGALLPQSSARYRTWRETRMREVRQVAAFLGSLGSLDSALGVPSFTTPDPADADLVTRGRARFQSVGCLGCHAVDATVAARGSRTLPYAPNLARIGEKATASWLDIWLRDPAHIWPNTRMPNLRLTDSERVELVAYLVTLRAPSTDPVIPDWPRADPADVAAGREAVQRYGCYGCHAIPGFEGAGRAGADLDDFGDKTADRLAWGDAQITCAQPDLECWTLIKLRQPRRFTGQNLLATMPDLNVSEQDAQALAVFLLAHRQRRVDERYRVERPEANRALQDGERVIRRRNCRGCHEIGRTETPITDDGGNVVDVQYTPIGAEILRYYEDPALAPPSLSFAGNKLRYDWLYGFLSAPTRVRPWLAIRMPTFALSREEKETLVRYFAARNEAAYPFEVEEPPTLRPEERPEALAMFGFLQCTRCHMLSSAQQLGAGELAPDLALASARLKTAWIRDWILDPQTRQPGTMMPSYFPLADETDRSSTMTTCPQFLGGDVARQVDALAALTLEFGGHRATP